MAKAEQTARVLDFDSSESEGEGGKVDAERIQSWLLAYLGRLLDIPVDEISTEETFQSFGLDSAAAVGLTGDLGRWLNMKLDPTLAYDHPTIESLSRHLAHQVAAKS